MKTIPEIANFFNDNKIFIISENRPFFTFADIKKQINWIKVFFKNQKILKTDTVAIVLENGPEMASCFLSVASNCCAAPLNPSYTKFEFNLSLIHI